ncbi:MAG: hypothetical protein IIB64_05870 [Proteobacteria bacterium]|nr:hypothetical protein [Pseudomonadota bacterium]
MKTFRPAQPEERKARELTEEDIQALAAWRSPEGVPWTTWAYENELTLESHEVFAIRREAAGFVITDEVYATVLRFLLKQEGIGPTPEVIGFFTGGGEVPEIFTGEDNWNPYFRLTRWFRENVSAMASETFTGISESYAWYTSPGYEKGSLPEELEVAMELMKEGNVPENYQDFGAATDWAFRASEIIKSGEIPATQPPYYAAVSDHEFFQMNETLASLPDYRELLEVLNKLYDNPEGSEQDYEKFVTLIGKFSWPKEHYLKVWADRVVEDRQFLEEYKGTSDDQLVDRDESGELPLGYHRETLKTSLEILKEEIEAFIRKWSELRSTDD